MSPPPPRVLCRTPSHLALALDAEGLVQDVAEKSEDDYRHKHREPGKRYRPPVGEKVWAGGRDHAAPIRRRGLAAQPEKTETGREENGVPHVDGHPGDDDAPALRQHVLEEDPGLRQTQRVRRF